MNKPKWSPEPWRWGCWKPAPRKADRSFGGSVFCPPDDPKAQFESLVLSWAEYGQHSPEFGEEFTVLGSSADHGYQSYLEISDEDRERLTGCVNACAGIEDPAAAIQAAREALEWNQNLPGTNGAKARKALALLTS